MSPASSISVESPSINSVQTEWFAREVQPHEPKLRAWLRARFPTLTDVDDLVQESYARLLRARQRGGIKNTKTYLFATARNAALDLLRRSQVVPIDSVAEIEKLSVLEEAPGAADALNRKQELAVLSEAMEALPNRCRHVLILQKIQGLSYKEIADRLGISENTVNAQIAKGVLRVREFMRRRQSEEQTR